MPNATALRYTRARATGSVELVLDADHYDRVVLDGILKAQVSLDIRTADFKAMRVPVGRSGCARSIVEVFRERADQGVEIRLLHSGVPSGPVLAALDRLVHARIRVRRCPRQHAKTVIVDARTMYLGSANLTGAGLGAKSHRKRNFEAGIWTRSPELIDPILEQFNALWEGRLCTSCGRRVLCPIPLEEPDPR